MMEGEEGRTARKKREARERIIAAAAELFMEKGARAVSMDEVAQAADVARRTLFNYFESKEELLVATAGPGAAGVPGFRFWIRTISKTGFFQRRLTAGGLWRSAMSTFR